MTHDLRQAPARRDAGKSPSYSFGPFELFPERQLLLKNGAVVRLGARALHLLAALVREAGEIVSHRALMSQVWGDVVVEDDNLKVNMSALRRALGDGNGVAPYIATNRSRSTCRGHAWSRSWDRGASASRPSRWRSRSDFSANFGMGGSWTCRRSRLWCVPEVLRVRGAVLLGRRDDDGAEAALLVAMQKAKTLGALSRELRAADLAAIWLRQGRLREARAVLEPLVEPFTEGTPPPTCASRRGCCVTLRLEEHG